MVEYVFRTPCVTRPPPYLNGFCAVMVDFLDYEKIYSLVFSGKITYANQISDTGIIYSLFKDSVSLSFIAIIMKKCLDAYMRRLFVIVIMTFAQEETSGCMNLSTRHCSIINLSR